MIVFLQFLCDWNGIMDLEPENNKFWNYIQVPGSGYRSKLKMNMQQRRKQK